MQEIVDVVEMIKPEAIMNEINERVDEIDLTDVEALEVKTLIRDIVGTLLRARVQVMEREIEALERLRMLDDSLDREVNCND